MINQEPAKPAKYRMRKIHADSPVGKNAVSITPPAYGVDLVDEGITASVPASAPMQLQGDLEDEKLLQGKFAPAQGEIDLEGEELLQGKFATVAETMHLETGIEQFENQTGMPGPLKTGLERLSGFDMSGVRVHYNSSKPKQVNALAYTQGSEIHVGPGQERHLPHEAWHVVQQMQGRVRPTIQAKGVSINDDSGLEHEADEMGAKAAGIRRSTSFAAAQATPSTKGAGLISQRSGPNTNMPIMRKLGFEYELGGITPKKNANLTSFFAPTFKQMGKGEVIDDKGDYQITADLAEGGTNNLEFITRPFDENNIGELNVLSTVATSIRDDINEMTGKSLNTDIPLNNFHRISGSPSIFLNIAQSDPIGQLQMTGGVDLMKLSGLMSGQELGSIPEGKLSPEESARAMPLQKYYAIGIDGSAMGLPYSIALNAVRRLFPEVKPAGQEMIAAAGALMAQLIFEHRQKPFDISARLEGGSGRFIAKTDYATMLQLIDEKIPERKEWNRFPDVVLSTAERFVDTATLKDRESVDSLTLESPVFPSYYAITGGISFPELTIGQWVTAALPQGRIAETEEVYEDFGYTGGFVERETGRMVPVGEDLLTKKSYPGSTRQRGELGAYGAYGSKTDPDDKMILEWRDLYSIHPASLPQVMGALFKYYSNIGFSGLYPEIKRDIPGYRGLVSDMPPGQGREKAVEYFNIALWLFERSAGESYGESQDSLAMARRFFEKAFDEVIDDRIVRDRARRYGY